MKQGYFKSWPTSWPTSRPTNRPTSHLKSPQVTLSHLKSPWVTSSHLKSPQVTNPSINCCLRLNFSLVLLATAKSPTAHTVFDITCLIILRVLKIAGTIDRLRSSLIQLCHVIQLNEGWTQSVNWRSSWLLMPLVLNFTYFFSGLNQNIAVNWKK